MNLVPRLALIVALVLALPEVAAADPRGTPVSSLDQLHQVCRRAHRGEPPALHAITLGSGQWAFGRYLFDDEFLPVDTRRNLRLFQGSAELLPARLQSIGFAVPEDRAGELRRAHRGGARLRIGFFLGFDDPDRDACLIRPAAGVTLVRAEIAYVELVDAQGRVMQRENDDRLRAWLDDEAHSAVPGSGPRGIVLAPTTGPDAWREAIGAAGRGGITRVLSACHAGGVERGASRHGEVVVRATVDPRTGAISRAEVELSSIGDDEDAECVARAVAQMRLPPDPASRATSVEISIPVRLAADDALPRPPATTERRPPARRPQRGQPARPRRN